MRAPIDTLAAFRPGLDLSSATAYRYVLMDVFTARPLEGNQLAVFTDGRGLSGEQMQRLALELKLSESVFALPAQRGGEMAIRIFTPGAELPFAGHPVLGAGIVVGGALGREAVTLETGMGLVRVGLRREGGVVVSGWMSQPIPTWRRFEQEEELLRALGVGGSGLPIEIYENGPEHIYVELENEAAVAALRPEMGALANLGEAGVSCFAGSGRHWVARVFHPSLGVPEDPATGSAAGPLALHLARHGRIDFGAEIEIRQGAAIKRPSLLYAFAEGSSEQVESVQVGGSAVVVGGGEFLLG